MAVLRDGRRNAAGQWGLSALASLGQTFFPNTREGYLQAVYAINDPELAREER